MWVMGWREDLEQLSELKRYLMRVYSIVHQRPAHAARVER